MLDFELCRAMHWSWPDLQATPAYVKRAFWDILQARNQAEADQQERERRHAS